MIFRAFSKLCFRIAGWRVKGRLPDLKKYVVITAPHTSNWDFILGVLARSIMKLKAKYLGKKELFKPPFGFIFRAMGGYPVDRSKHHNLVDAVVEIFNTKEQFILGIAPEGTRKYAPKWKTGFYYIALGAGVPIVMTGFDYANKEVSFAEPFFPTGNIESDMQVFMDHYRNIKGKHPDQGVR